MYRDLIFSRSFRFVALIIIPSSVFATEAAVSEQSYLQEFPVVLTASRLSQPLSESPSSMTIVDRQMIRASGFRSVVDLFRLVPGMYVGNEGANNPFVSLNGVTDVFSRRMQVLVDGRSIYLPPFGGVDWKGLPVLLDDIERIEVVRGPSAASHGTNSFYGVINIITRDVTSTDGDRLSMGSGDFGMADVTARHSRTGEHFDYRLSYSYQSDDGDNPQVLNDVSRSQTVSFRSDWRVNPYDNVEIQMGVNAGERGMGILGRLDKDPFRTAKIQNDFQQVTWAHVWTSGDESKLVYYRINRDYSDPFKADWSANPIKYQADISKGLRQDVEIQNTLQLRQNNRVVWGGGFRYDFAEQSRIFSSSHGLNQSRFFVHDEWRPIESTVLNFGTMFEDDGAGHKNNSPRISINYHIQPQHTLRASYATATRNPVMAEMYLTAGKNQYWSRAYVPPIMELRPEKIITREIGYVGHFGQLKLDGRIYYEKVSDITGLDFYADLSNPVKPSSSFKNLTDGTFKGLEISADYRWDTGRVNLNYARQQASCYFSSFPTQYFSTNVTYTNPFTLGQYLQPIYQFDFLNLCSETVPANNVSVLVTQRLDETIDFSTGYYFRDSVRVMDVDSKLPAESTMHRVDFRLAKRFGKEERPGGGEVAVILQNAFQDNYTGYGNVAETANLLFKRRAYLTASIYF